MTRFFSLFSFFCFLFPPASLDAFAATLKEDVLLNVVHIDAGKYLGSGITIVHNGELHVLTAAHVVSDVMKLKSIRFIDAKGEVYSREEKVTPRYVDCTWKNDTKLRCQVVWYSADWEGGAIDLALLKPDAAGLKLLKDAGVKGATLAGKEDAGLEEGEDAWYCGSGGGIKWGLEKTIISRFDDRYLVVNGCGWFGHSGSGVFVKRGDSFKLVGIISQFIQHPNENFKSPIEAERQLQTFLDGVPK